MFFEFEGITDYIDFLTSTWMRCPDRFDNKGYEGTDYFLDKERAFNILIDRIWILEKKLKDKSKIPPYRELLMKASAEFDEGNNRAGTELLGEAVQLLKSKPRKPA